MENNNEVFDDDVMVTIELDNGQTVSCEILTVFELNSQNYIVVEPEETYNDPDCDEADIYVYRYFEEGDSYRLENIDSDEEYEAVSEALDELMDAAMYDNM